MPFNPRNFQQSITNELNLIKDRVNNLIEIDAPHQGEIGAYKEAILRKVIKRFLPNNLSIGTGFVVKQNDDNTFIRTSQIDIIIYDNTYPLLFSEGDFIIATPENIKGIIEVKTTIQASGDQGYDAIIEKASSNMDIIGNNQIFNGIFAYNYDNTSDNSLFCGNRRRLRTPVERSLQNSNGKVNHISLGSNIFIKFWDENHNLNYNNNCPSNRFYNIYSINNLSFSYFISNLIDYVVESTEGRHWFMFPIDSQNGKEDNKIGHCCLNLGY
ncbi:hypothetical protein N5U06_10630 [Aliarcobacter butzleri]|uniref:DUF6602 domain-containing protein n=1 Tax=Aliarcobacter butzleri TaxID=28197 RepID=UPI001EDCC90A|nr:DUF6602 domain-containing protein [Aliarcobacter butzleri]MCG3669273.1 hypothetical protein [Aliarcobacter butzleri]MCT7557617.1 hypothetical protein [Aliarcobacter butzleri]MCT7631179.1 hypothetical protein [Aliarcobacter butzleri]